MENKILSAEEILELLHQHNCEVTFRKVDGEIRVMSCTLRAEELPPRVVVENAKTKAPTPGVISVWALDKKEWRSFRTNNVISVTPITV
jgi:hypothetical protein